MVRYRLKATLVDISWRLAYVISVVGQACFAEDTKPIANDGGMAALGLATGVSQDPVCQETKSLVMAAVTNPWKRCT